MYSRKCNYLDRSAKWYPKYLLISIGFPKLFWVQPSNMLWIFLNCKICYGMLLYFIFIWIFWRSLFIWHLFNNKLMFLLLTMTQSINITFNFKYILREIHDSTSISVTEAVYFCHLFQANHALLSYCNEKIAAVEVVTSRQLHAYIHIYIYGATYSWES